MKNKLLTTSIAFAISSGVMFSAPFSNAGQRVITGNDMYLTTDSMDPTRSQTLNIKKLPRNPHDDPVPGSKVFGGVEGVTFRLSMVSGVEVSTEVGREAAKRYTVNRAREYGFGDIWEQKTNANGEAVFRELSPGLYLIEEIAPDKDHDWRSSRPQLVILPFGDVKGENYTYDNVLVTKPESTISPGSPDDPGTPPASSGEPSNSPLTPEEPGGPASPEANDNSHVADKAAPGRNGELAITGVNVLWIFLAGVGLIVSGFVLMRRKNREINSYV